jgi:hypothetical protein
MTLYIMEYLGRDWCEENLRAIVFDSCPPMSDIYGMEQGRRLNFIFVVLA